MTRRGKGATRNNSTPRPGLPRRVVVAAAFAAMAAGLLYLGVQKLLAPSVLPVRSVRIESPLKRVTQEQLREVIGRHAQAGFLWLDVDRLRAELETLPWVMQASVRRGWPDLLVVRIEEQQAVAHWGAGGLINSHGELFRPGEEKGGAQLPLLRGPQNTQRQMVSELQRMQEMLTPLGLQISHLTMNERRAWSLRLANGLQLGLGRNDVHLRLLRFVRVYAEALEPRLDDIDGIDLRYTNGFAVRWREGHAPAAV